MVKEIPLTRGKIALVDDEDYDELMKYKWFSIKGSTIYHYARRTSSENGQKKVSMHRQIMGFPDCLIDHINRDGLDNRRCNLRLCSQGENKRNCKKYTSNSSGFRGVSWHKHLHKWQARIQFNYITQRIGYFNNKEQAAKAYDERAKELFGAFAVLNFPEETYG
jgi:hypothetical protein